MWSSPKEKQPTLLRYDPPSKRLVNAGCVCTPQVQPIPPPPTTYEFVKVAGTIGVDPGSGNFTSNLTSPPNVVLQFNKTDKNSIDASSYLSTISSVGNTLTITKDPSNYSTFSISGSTDFGTYWSFGCVITSFSGTVNNGDTVTLTYT